MTVLQIVPALTAGGVETGTVDLARALVAQGHRAIVISSGGPLVKEVEAAGAVHYTLPVHEKMPWTILRMVRRVAEVVESHEVDLIHVRSRVPATIGYLAWRRVAARASFRLGSRQRLPSFITTAHGHYTPHLGSQVMGWGRYTIAISEAIARHMLDRFGVPLEKIRLIPRGVDLARFDFRPPREAAPKGDWRISAIGRLTPIKGHRELLRAFAAVAKTFPKSKLFIVGQASPRHERYLKELQEMTLRLGIGHQVEFTGHEPDVAGHLAQVDLLVLPSVGEEAFGRALIEAGACGVPAIGTRIGGISEVIADRKSGLLVPPGDPAALSQAILKLLKDRAWAAELAQENRRRVETLFPLTRMVQETLSVYTEASQTLRILVIKLSAIGDIALVTPSLRALRQRFPKAHVTVLVGREGSELLNRCPYLDDLAVFDPQRDGGLAGLLRLASRLRKAQVDLVVDFQNNRISHWMGFLTAAPQRYGYGGRRFSTLLTHRASPPELPIPPVQHQFHLLELLGISGASDELELWPGSADSEKAELLLKEAWVAEHQPVVAVHPGGHPSWLSKRWPLSRYAELVDRLALEAKARVILTGSAMERPLADQIYGLSKTKPAVFVGRTSLNELAALLRHCQAFVGSDTAALHIAAGVGTPIVALFGATDPRRHLPPSRQLKLLKVDLPCSPCYHRVCYRHGAGHMECMKRISVEDVLAGVMSHLNEERVPGFNLAPGTVPRSR